jgi:hypothetical protein
VTGGHTRAASKSGAAFFRYKKKRYQ